MDIRLANASQASMVVIFVPNVNECPVMQKFVAKLFTKKAVPKEGKANQTKKEKELNTNITKKHVGKCQFAWTKLILTWPQTSTC
jgi:hypothetical protein